MTIGPASARALAQLWPRMAARARIALRLVSATPALLADLARLTPACAVLQLAGAAAARRASASPGGDYSFFFFFFWVPFFFFGLVFFFFF